jgi:hypothetical protein
LMRSKIPRTVNALTSMAPTVMLSFQRGPTPPQCPDTHFLQSNGSPSYSLCDLQPYRWAFGLLDLLTTYRSHYK